MRLSRLSDERGFALAPVLLGGAFISLLVVVAAGAVNRDLGLTRDDLHHKQAYEAARAGIADYAFHLNRDTNYWARCTSVPEPSAVNQVNADPLKTRPVPGSSGATYAIELLPRTSPAPAAFCDPANPVGTMIEQSGPSPGTFRIRSTGYSGDASQSIVASFKRASFLDYLYFTQLETSDPVTYGFTSQTAIQGVNSQCTKTIAEGRNDAPIPGTSQFCDVIVFPDWDRINGPLHTNDALVTCGEPVFGRTAADVISVSSPEPGWEAGCASSDPDFVGEFLTNRPVLTPPPTNGQLEHIAETNDARYAGQTRIVLNGNRMFVNGASSSIPIPPNGVVYVDAGTGPCSTGYSPYTTRYPTSSACGNVYVRGTYSVPLTIAAYNDIIVNGNLTRAGNGMLGLIANNFVRVYHPYRDQQGRRDCDGGDNGSNLPGSWGSTQPSQIDAAILAIQHSFIVDHYDCGGPIGTLTINGAIGQKFRGAVGTFSGSNLVNGYEKNYNYDDRLRYISPPHFLDPVESAWHIQRQTLDYPEAP